MKNCRIGRVTDYDRSLVSNEVPTTTAKKKFVAFSGVAPNTLCAAFLLLFAVELGKSSPDSSASDGRNGLQPRRACGGGGSGLSVCRWVGR